MIRQHRPSPGERHRYDAAVRERAHGLGPGSILMHIGVHKTGTTAVQDALAGTRPLLEEHGVRYPGRHQAHRDIASAAMGRRLGWRTDGARDPDPARWTRFVREAHAHAGTTVLSSEFLAESDDATAARIIEAVGADRVHVVVTLRNLGRILPSAWQQILKSGFETRYTDWLDRTLNRAPAEPKPGTFWNRHRHDEVVQRWAGLVGPERFTVVVVDESQREAIYWDFEALLGLPRDLLLDHRVAANRSMTAAEAEFLRRLNVTVGGRPGWQPYDHRVHDRLIKAIVEARIPADDEPRLQTPQWALDRAAEHGARYVEAIQASGVNVVGDLEVLRRRLTGPEAIEEDALVDLPIDVAVSAVLGAASTARTNRPEDRHGPKPRSARGWARRLRRG